MGVLVGSPLISALGLDGNLVALVLFASLAAASIRASTGQQRKWLLVSLAGAAVARVFGRFQHIEAASTGAMVVWIAVAGVAAVKAFRFALSSREVDSEHISAALSVYVLAGHFFGLTYWRLEHVAPGSFTSGGAALTSRSFDLPSAIYFSFVALTTVGFRDIVPASTVSRGLAITEAVLGQFYMVVLVASLVSSYTQRSANP